MANSNISNDTKNMFNVGDFVKFSHEQLGIIFAEILYVDGKWVGFNNLEHNLKCRFIHKNLIKDGWKIEKNPKVYPPINFTFNKSCCTEGQWQYLLRAHKQKPKGFLISIPYNEVGMSYEMFIMQEQKFVSTYGRNFFDTIRVFFEKKHKEHGFQVILCGEADHYYIEYPTDKHFERKIFKVLE